jgi:chromosome segregation ATPase
MREMSPSKDFDTIDFAQRPVVSEDIRKLHVEHTNFVSLLRDQHEQSLKEFHAKVRSCESLLEKEKSKCMRLERSIEAALQGKKDLSGDAETIRSELNAVLIENSELKRRIDVITKELNSNLSKMEFLEHEKARLDRERLDLVKALRIKDSQHARTKLLSNSS